MVIICGCGGLGSFLVGEQTTFWIGVTIWILHPRHNNKVVVEGIVGPQKGSQASTLALLASLCGTNQQMVMVIKVIQEDTMVFFSNKVENPTKIATLDEACIPLAPDKTYILWNTSLLVEK
jgi:hypothetical protein